MEIGPLKKEEKPQLLHCHFTSHILQILITKKKELPYTEQNRRKKDNEKSAKKSNHKKREIRIYCQESKKTKLQRAACSLWAHDSYTRNR